MQQNLTIFVGAYLKFYDYIYYVSFKTFEFFFVDIFLFLGWVCFFFLFYNIDIKKFIFITTFFNYKNT